MSINQDFNIELMKLLEDEGDDDDACNLFFYECTEYGFVENSWYSMGFEDGKKVEKTVRDEMKIVLSLQETPG